MADARRVVPTLPPMDIKESEAVQANGENVAEGFKKRSGGVKLDISTRLRLCEEARKAYDENPSEERKIANQKFHAKWRKGVEKALCVVGPDMTQVNEWEMCPGSYGANLLNLITIQNARKRKADMVAKNKMKEADPKFYRGDA